MSYHLAMVGATFAILLLLLSGFVGLVMFATFMILNALIELMRGN